MGLPEEGYLKFRDTHEYVSARELCVADSDEGQNTSDYLVPRVLLNRNDRETPSLPSSESGAFVTVEQAGIPYRIPISGVWGVVKLDSPPPQDDAGYLMVDGAESVAC